MKLISPHINYRNKGFTLVELLISMVLGLTIIGGSMSLFFGSKETDKSRLELITIESNARVALKTLRETLAHTGYPSVEAIYLDKAFQTPADGTIVNPDCRSDVTTKMIVNSNFLTTIPTEFEGFTKDGANGTSDRLTSIIRPDNPDDGNIFLDCGYEGYAGSVAKQKACSTDRANSNVAGDTAEGMNDPIQSRIYNGFYLKNNQLICEGSRSSSSTPFVVADGIENIQFLYGVFKDGATTFKNATDVETESEWESVNSIQVALLVGSSVDVLKTSQTKTYQLLDVETSVTSKKMFKIYTSTISLPNRQQ